MAAIRKVEDLSTNLNFIGYYDIEDMVHFTNESKEKILDIIEEYERKKA
jgi:hypothetical protein